MRRSERDKEVCLVKEEGRRRGRWRTRRSGVMVEVEREKNSLCRMNWECDVRKKQGVKSISSVR